MATLPEEVDPQVWLAYAREDLAAAHATIEQVSFPRQSAYHSHQAAEKAIKAVLFHCGTPPPFIHDLQRLVQLLPVAQQPPVDAAALAELSSWAVAQRYPGMTRVVACAEAESSLQTADLIVTWAAAQLDSAKDYP